MQRILIETTPSGRSHCYSCHNLIAMNSLRIQETKIQTNRHRSLFTTSFFHIYCFTLNSNNYKGLAIEGPINLVKILKCFYNENRKNYLRSFKADLECQINVCKTDGDHINIISTSLARSGYKTGTKEKYIIQVSKNYLFIQRTQTRPRADVKIVEKLFQRPSYQECLKVANKLKDRLVAKGFKTNKGNLNIYLIKTESYCTW